MPRIRKKTSNRGTTNQRKRILGKVRESRKKAKKAAKKNPQWKSKSPKDPGIPNNFPFKDQVLAEVSEQRRITAEEKLRKKEERKIARAKVKGGDPEEQKDEEDTEEVGETIGVELEPLTGLQIGNDNVGGIGARRLANAKALTRPTAVHIEDVDEDEEDAPVLINRDLPNLEAVIDDSDVVIQVLDARDPLSFRSSHLEELVTKKPGRRVLFILNKIDACPRESVAAWASHLRTQHPTLIFRSASAFLPSNPEPSTKVKGKGKAKMPTHDGLGVDSVLACLGGWAQSKEGDEMLSVSVMGLTNAGKSSFINSLLRKSALPVYTLTTSSRGPTTTELPQEVTLEAGGKQIRLIDTPGLTWDMDGSVEDLEEARARDILLRSKGRIDRLKDPVLAVSHIVARSNAEDLMLLYSLPAFAKGDPNSFLAGVARSHQLIKKKGELDLIGASRIVLRDWGTGKFPRYTTPASGTLTSVPQPADTTLETSYAMDDSILANLQLRKEMRKSGGLIRFLSGEVEPRKADISGRWNSLEDDDGEAEEGEDEDEMEVDEGVEDEEDEDEDEDEDEGDEDESEDSPPPTSNKQKRKRTNEIPAAPPSKKVTFGFDPKSTKKDRKADSLKGKATKPALKIKSAASTTAKTKTVTGKREKKVANITRKKTLVATPDVGSGEAYDFGKFF
ncbi:hypothetical protein BDZ94DRAFT_1303952 [Collybia nuda]|uniref:Uncharacterized protein n=1 Tax=Collybia nuda TaxID=64659 RepID=A0A9P5YGD4_9AGAR|nr:hypothetical protein BDZ94DRAFT_1303952 [Collybia nuda]